MAIITGRWVSSAQVSTVHATPERHFQLKKFLFASKFLGLTHNNCMEYLDDIQIFRRHRNQHTNNSFAVLERLRAVNLKINPRRCGFLKKELLYIGHLISKNELKPYSEKCEAVREYPTPTNADEVRRFVEFANSYESLWLILRR